MTREDPFVAHCVDLLSPVAAVRARAMFGGWGLYAGAAMLALIADDELYLKVDGETRGAFAAAGCEPFVWDGPRGPVTFSFFQPPPEALESPEEMQRWGRLALEAARRAAAKKTSRSRSQPGSGSGSKSRSGSRSGSKSRSGSRSGSRSKSRSGSR